jgi:serine/threonine protein kinase
MNSAVPDLKSIFGQAAEIASPAERAAFLDEACGEDANLRAQIDGLLAAAEKAGSFMHGPAIAHSETEMYPPVSEGPGTVIGPYKLLQQIGEGGMGVVFMAEQTEPIQRTVALKIIKPGMDTRQVIARFEAERQALALMDHPNIARVLDAGTTGGGSRDEGRGTRAGKEDPLALDSRPSTTPAARTS